MNASPSTVQALADALEAVLDLWLDGRIDALDEREEAALKAADAALAAASAAV